MLYTIVKKCTSLDDEKGDVDLEEIMKEDSNTPSE
jgi:hypothetical protein|tara:strand:- start:298 stop:402 length:105 start_codon:yes stop_codon:yes gene_type:complete